MSAPATFADSLVAVDLLATDHRCAGSPQCATYINQFQNRMIGRYVRAGSDDDLPVRSAVIDLRELDFVEYMDAVKRVHKGAAVRHAHKADRLDLVCRQFVWRNRIPDIVEINNSKDVRCGGPMTRAYRRSIDELGGAPTTFAQLVVPACYLHCCYCWGIFLPRVGHRQGNLPIDDQLIAYIKVKRQGNLGIYTSILGHGDFLRFGIMYRLHFAVMQWIARERDHGVLTGLEHLMYGADESGGPGLRQWKKRCRFQGRYLETADPTESTPQPTTVLTGTGNS